MVFSCGSISFRVVNKDANIVRVFIFCTLLWMLAKGVEMCENDTLRFVIALVTICLSLFNIADAALEQIKYNRSQKFIRTGYDSFEPSVDHRVLSFDPAVSIKHELLFFLSIVKSLKLNENIWQD